MKFLKALSQIFKITPTCSFRLLRNHSREKSEKNFHLRIPAKSKIYVFFIFHGICTVNYHRHHYCHSALSDIQYHFLKNVLKCSFLSRMLKHSFFSSSRCFGCKVTHEERERLANGFSLKK